MTDDDNPGQLDSLVGSFENLLNAGETLDRFRAAGARWREGYISSELDAATEAVFGLLRDKLIGLDDAFLMSMSHAISTQLLANPESAKRIGRMLEDPNP